MPPALLDSQLPLLVARARSQDLRAWDSLLRSHQLPVYAYVAELVRDRTLAMDLVQEAFLDALRGIDSLREDARFSSWLFGIAHQRCLRYFRRDRRTRERFEDGHTSEWELLDEGQVPPFEYLIGDEDREAFMAQLSKLPETQRSVLLLHFLEDFSLEEIAGITAVPVGTVKSRLHHAKRNMRQFLEESR